MQLLTLHEEIEGYKLRLLSRFLYLQMIGDLTVHRGNSKGTTCVVDRDITAYLVVDRVLRFPTEQYGCRYGEYQGFKDVKVIF